MKKGLNKMCLLGNVGQDPEIRPLPSGGNVASLTVATGDYWKDKETQEPREKTEWHRVVVFGALADLVAKRVQKGTQLYIEAESRTRSFKAQDGVTDVYRQEFVIEGYGDVLQVIGGAKPKEQ